MDYFKESSLVRVDGRAIAQFLGLATVATALPFFIHIQWITGPIINAILIILLFVVGIRSALMVCLIPSIMALASGLLPAVLAPVAPFVMISNVIFILSIEQIYEANKNSERGYWLGVLTGALLKFVFLFLSINVIAGLLLRKELAVSVTQMMSWPQFTTALLGGVIAWAVLKWLRRF
jgi:hypothetical protein